MTFPSHQRDAGYVRPVICRLRHAVSAVADKKGHCSQRADDSLCNQRVWRQRFCQDSGSGGNPAGNRADGIYRCRSRQPRSELF